MSVGMADGKKKHRKGQNPLVCHGHSRPIVDLHYSPITEDGYFLVSASKDGKPMLRNGANGDWIGTFEGHKGAVWSACLNHPATLTATGSGDFTARVWDALTGDLVHELNHKHIVRCVSFSRDSTKLVTGGHEKVLRVFDLAKPEADPVVLEAQASPIRCAVWSTFDPNRLYTSLSGEPGICAWDMRANAVVQRWETSDVVTSIELSDEDVVTTASGKQVAFWKAQTGEAIRKQDLDFKVESASLCIQKNCFASGGEDMWVRLFDYKTGEEIDCNRGHHGPVHCVRFAPDGESYASGSEDGTIRIWQTDPKDNPSNNASNNNNAAAAPVKNGAAEPEEDANVSSSNSDEGAQEKKNEGEENEEKKAKDAGEDDDTKEGA
mmetsp:Transcript_1579/g.3480  ORF Transcript_1579/g.3480 Transcript_1579/m.3480 type:complete len:379 (+) Transcript_1579:405-1541(+)